MARSLLWLALAFTFVGAAPLPAAEEQVSDRVFLVRDKPEQHPAVNPAEVDFIRAGAIENNEDAPGREGHTRQGRGKHHRSDRGDSQERGQHRVPQVGKHPARALRSIKPAHDQQHDGGEDIDGIWNRARRAQFGPGSMPRGSQPGQSEGGGEQARLDP